MTEAPPQLVIADDDATVRNLLVMHAQRGGFTVAAAEDGAAALDLIVDETEVVLLDLRMPVLDGFGCLERLGAEWPGLPAIVLSSQDEAVEAVRAMKLGAMDYLTKPFDPDELLAVLRNARRMRRAELENEALREALGGAAPERPMVVGSEAMQALQEEAGRVAVSDSPVLLTGESGVGKGMLARYVHSRSARSDKQFVTVGCAGLPREMLISELFGHEKGAFEGAMRRRSGKIEAANGGTLYIDEVADLPTDLQLMLLEFLEKGSFRRVGGIDALHADVRVVAATSDDLQRKIGDGEFLEDLYYRLSVIPIEVPPLRERLEEIELLAEDILPRVVRASRGRDIRVSRGALRLLQGYDWPGNLRQLENVLERSAAMCQGGVIEETDLPDVVRGSSPDSRIPAGLGGIRLVDLEREALVQTMKLCHGNKAETARRLGVTEKSIYNKLKRLGLM